MDQDKYNPNVYYICKFSGFRFVIFCDLQEEIWRPHDLFSSSGPNFPVAFGFIGGTDFAIAAHVTVLNRETEKVTMLMGESHPT